MKKVKIRQKVHFYDEHGNKQDAMVIKHMKKNKVIVYTFEYAQHNIPLIGYRRLIPIKELRNGWTSVYTKKISKKDLESWFNSVRKRER